MLIKFQLSGLGDGGLYEVPSEQLYIAHGLVVETLPIGSLISSE